MITDNTKLFEFVYDAVISEGGDGDCAIVLKSQNHKIVSDQFELFLKTKPYGNWQRADKDNGDIILWDQQEYIVFSNHDHFCSFSDAVSGKGYPEGKVPCTQKVITL